MIHTIRIENFRAFGPPIDLRLRPITVMIGKNSAGKSTLIKFLLMLRQTVETNDTAFLSTEGRHVDLGAFRQLRNSRYPKRLLKFRIGLNSAELPPTAMMQLHDAIRRRVRRGNLIPDEFELSLRLKKAAIQDRVGDVSYDISAEANYFSRKPVGRHRVVADDQTGTFFDTHAGSLRDVRFLKFPANTTRPEGELDSLVAESFLVPARRVIADVRHLSPVREESSLTMPSNPPTDDVGHRGEYAMPHLYNILEQRGERADFILRFIGGVTNIDELAFKSRARHFRSHFRGRNIDTGAHCYLADFGFGVSQCLPIFVQGALLQRGQLLIVEQPEAQVHPTAQMELGSFFRDLWRDRGVPSLIETHSANIILRLRRLISNGDLQPDEVSIAYFAVEKGDTVVRNIGIQADGRLEKGLPREFFGADVLEALKMGKRDE